MGVHAALVQHANKRRPDLFSCASPCFCFARLVERKILAALAYSRNEPGLWFLNPPQWVTHHMFMDVSIWDIPLVKPRFACSMDMALSTKGYDMGAGLATTFERLKGNC